MEGIHQRMRKYCLDCTIKHLAQAMVTHQEALMGYPEHILLSIGHLAEASEECFGVSEELANEIRQYRLLLMADRQVEIPYFMLYNKIVELIGTNGCGDCQKASENFKDRLKSQLEK